MRAGRGDALGLGRTGGHAPWLELKPDYTTGEICAGVRRPRRKAIEREPTRVAGLHELHRRGQPGGRAFLHKPSSARPPPLAELDARVADQLVAALVSTRDHAGLNTGDLSAMSSVLARRSAWEQRRWTSRSASEVWYKGDGAYGDGPEFHWDYYNSFVIQPMMIDVLEATLASKDEWPQRGKWAKFLPAVLKRAVRFAEVQERLISPEGTFPPLGRSLAYRFGALRCSNGARDGSYRPPHPCQCGPG